MSLNFKYFAILGSAALLSSACNIRWVDDPSLLEDDDVSWEDAVDDGEGGGDVTGTGGEGGGDETAICAWEGSGESAAICDTLPTSPTYIGANACGDDVEAIDAYSYLSCQKGFEIFNGTQAEEFASCLAGVAAADACSVDPIGECSSQLYANACEMDDVSALCLEMTDYCGDFGDDFDTAACQSDLNPMSIDAINGLIDCMNDAPYGTCGERYGSCLDDLLTL